MSNIQTWSERILKASSREEVFSIVEEFRPLDWTDEERASMAKIYNSRLNQFNLQLSTVSAKPSEKARKAKGSNNISKQDAGNQRGESMSADKDLDEDELA